MCPFVPLATEISNPRVGHLSREAQVLEQCVETRGTDSGGWTATENVNASVTCHVTFLFHYALAPVSMAMDEGGQSKVKLSPNQKHSVLVVHESNSQKIGEEIRNKCQ